MADPSRHNREKSFAEEATGKLWGRICDNTLPGEKAMKDLRKLVEKVLGKTSEKSKLGKETWWWHGKLQKSIQATEVQRNTLAKTTQTKTEQNAKDRTKWQKR